MLVIMHDRNIKFLDQTLLNFKAFRGFDILQINASKGGRDSLHSIHKFINIFSIDFNVENIDICEGFEQQAFPFHDGFTSQGSDVSETQYCGPI